MIPLSLGELAAVVGGAVEGDGAVMVTAPAVLDGRQAEPGGLFVAFAGEHADGHDYGIQAGRAGAVAVLGSRLSRRRNGLLIALRCGGQQCHHSDTRRDGAAMK